MCFSVVAKLSADKIKEQIESIGSNVAEWKDCLEGIVELPQQNDDDDGSYVPKQLPEVRAKRRYEEIDKVEVDYGENDDDDIVEVSSNDKRRKTSTQEKVEDIDEEDETSVSESFLEDGEFVEDTDEDTDEDDADFLPEKEMRRRELLKKVSEDDDSEIEIIAVNGIKVKK